MLPTIEEEAKLSWIRLMWKYRLQFQSMASGKSEENLEYPMLYPSFSITNSVDCFRGLWNAFGLVNFRYSCWQILKQP